LTIVIQRATTADIETLSRIEQECFIWEAFSKRLLTSLLKTPAAVSLLAKENDEAAGFVIGLVNDYGEIKLGHIVTIDVIPRYRRRGIATKLLQKVEKEFLNAGVRTSYLEVRDDNVAARKLYQKLEYRKVEVLKDYYSRGGDGIRLEKTLFS
jgi:ribosomal protein S18 acetylase RimI-like enzyme